MSRWTLLLFLSLGLGGCASQAGPREAEDHAGTGEEGLARQAAVDQESAAALEVDELYESFPPGAPQRCIDVRRVRSIEPIGNHTLLFHAGGGDVWRNRLPRSCPGLRRNSRFLYEPRGGRLCSLDVVYLLVDDGFGFRRGTGCPLGEFDYLTEEQAEALKHLR